MEAVLQNFLGDGTSPSLDFSANNAPGFDQLTTISHMGQSFGSLVYLKNKGIDIGGRASNPSTLTYVLNEISAVKALNADTSSDQNWLNILDAKVAPVHFSSAN